jgi:ElaB/YqjD/DUF883 family membrane-anchored ribosome-binding protein
MTSQDDESGHAAPAGPVSAAAKQAQQAVDSAKEFVAGTDFDQLRAKASDATAALYRQGRDMISNSDELSKARDQFTDSIRKNPIAAVGIAFTVGLVIALLTRG